jgi:uncharacterized membrane protein YbaN (DUF454 family)
VGLAFLALGIIGAILPGIPATPFLLLASYFLSRSWPALNRRLHQSRFFGGILQDWQQRRGVRRTVKVRAIVAVVASVLLTVFLSGFSALPALLVLSAAGLGVAVIVRLPEI